jgi:hypothetical protein
MMRLAILVAALCVTASASAENFLLKSNGLGAAALGEIGVTAGVMAFSRPPPWQGYPRGGEGLQFGSASGVGAMDYGDCATSEGSSVAKALLSQSGAPQAAPPDGVLSLSEAERRAADNAFDSKAIYQAGQPSTCPGH